MVAVCRALSRATAIVAVIFEREDIAVAWRCRHRAPQPPANRDASSIRFFTGLKAFGKALALFLGCRRCREARNQGRLFVSRKPAPASSSPFRFCTSLPPRVPKITRILTSYAFWTSIFMCRKSYVYISLVCPLPLDLLLRLK